MQYRLQASYRRRVTRRYLELPLSWHHRNSTGTLLSNANSDVEAAWYPIAPLPFAVGTLVMLVGAIVSLFATDWALALVGLAVFPALFALNVVYSRRMAPRQARAQRLRAEVSGIAHESFDGALVVKTMGREAQETARFAGRAGELRDSLIAVGRLRGMFDPLLETLPSLGTLAVLVVGAFRLRQGAISVTELVSVAFLFTVLAFPVRAIGWVLAELPRSVAGWDRVRRVLDATGEMPYGQRVLDPAGAGPATLTFDDVHYSYPPAEATRPARRSSARSASRCRAGRTVALVGADRRRQVHHRLARGASRRPGLRHCRAGRRGRARADLRRRWPAPWPWSPRCPSSSTTRSAPTSPSTGPVSTTRRSGRRCGSPGRRVRRRAARWSGHHGRRAGHLALRRSAAAAHPGPRAGRSAAAAGARRRDERGRSSSGGGHPGGAAVVDAQAGVPAASILVVAYRRATIALADEVIYVEQGRVVARGTHSELLATVPGYADLVTAYEQAEAERERESPRRRRRAEPWTEIEDR